MDDAFRGVLVPGMARGGFILSPFIGDQKSFALLATRDGLSSLADLAVTSVTVSAANKSGETACYLTPLRLRLYRLDYPRPNPGKTDVESTDPNQAR